MYFPLDVLPPKVEDVLEEVLVQFMHWHVLKSCVINPAGLIQ